MGESRVERISRLAQWKIDAFGPSSFRRSDAFKVGIWNWYLSIERNGNLYIHLFPEPCRTSKEQPPIARFVLRVSTSGGNRGPYISPVYEQLIRTSDDFVWAVDCAIVGRIVIDVEFLDLKMSTAGREPSSIWPGDGAMQNLANRSTLRWLSRMLEEGIHADITINTSDGSLKAHKAILSASSSVFTSMFVHNLREKESSTIDIDDMTTESCMALLNYIYGSMKQEEFWRHRLCLLAAANKYDIADLKDCCEEGLLEDITSNNVLERLQVAWLYQLNKLKKGCLMYLFNFGKIHDLRDEIDAFFQHADRELMLEMFHEVLSVWKLV